MRRSDVSLFEALNALAPSSAPATKLTAVERAREITPKKEAAPFPPEVLSKAKRLHLAQLTIQEVRAAGWIPSVVEGNRVAYSGTLLAQQVSHAVTRAAKLLREEIREVLLTEGRA